MPWQSSPPPLLGLGNGWTTHAYHLPCLGPSARPAPAAHPQDKGRARVTLEASWTMDDGYAVGASVATEEVRPDLIKAAGPGAAATVSLNDCLACR